MGLGVKADATDRTVCKQLFRKSILEAKWGQSWDSTFCFQKCSKNLRKENLQNSARQCRTGLRDLPSAHLLSSEYLVLHPKRMSQPPQLFLQHWHLLQSMRDQSYARKVKSDHATHRGGFTGLRKPIRYLISRRLSKTNTWRQVFTRVKLYLGTNEEF